MSDSGSPCQKRTEPFTASTALPMLSSRCLSGEPASLIPRYFGSVTANGSPTIGNDPLGVWASRPIGSNVDLLGFVFSPDI